MKTYLINGVETLLDNTDKVFICPKCYTAHVLLHSEWFSQKELSCDSCKVAFDLDWKTEL